MLLEVKAMHSQRVVLEDVDTSEDFTVGAVVEALQQSGRIPNQLVETARKDLALVIVRPNDGACLVPSQAQTWSSLEIKPEDTLMLISRHEEAMHLLQFEHTTSEVVMMTQLKQAQRLGLLSSEEYRVLVRIARDQHHPLHTGLRHIHAAFGTDLQDLVEEARDLLMTSGASGLVFDGREQQQPSPSPSQTQSHPPSLSQSQSQQPPKSQQQSQQQRPARPQAQHAQPPPYSTAANTTSAASTSNSKAASGSGSGGGGTGRTRVFLQHVPPTTQHDIMWMMSTLIIAFFSFMAMMTHVFFIKESSVFLGPVIHGLAGLLALYEVFGCRSLLGYDPFVHAIGHGVRDFLLVAFTFNATLDMYAFANAPHLTFSTLTTNFFGVLVTLVWLIALRCSWKSAPEADSVMALTLSLMTLFCTSVIHNLVHLDLTPAPI
ncbi:hypothetical protein PTSG_08556 [Salpingoeca rosetta]|uniref:Uncharacterized protein n=1 Tax=Salpingoeca rosetta (strain ATCC 50818 / BSB-021) TaxID=946362 RepID=F2UK12_SALR5|nr:uncharacterized protein PTSG_08556 [Salpingoeca rosetta]EGD77461.1 hypothetical protein PTSG_08556 [Salpingoeca rosetta]|eukprot:XP_004990349.1 hypothetical protein PTSG_08556 [Salpingoeca rosetta]